LPAFLGLDEASTAKPVQPLNLRLNGQAGRIANDEIILFLKLVSISRQAGGFANDEIILLLSLVA
jgi:hypothetical protein